MTHRLTITAAAVATAAAALAGFSGAAASAASASTVASTTSSGQVRGSLIGSHAGPEYYCMTTYGRSTGSPVWYEICNAGGHQTWQVTRNGSLVQLRLGGTRQYLNDSGGTASLGTRATWLGSRPALNGRTRLFAPGGKVQAGAGFGTKVTFNVKGLGWALP